MTKKLTQVERSLRKLLEDPGLAHTHSEQLRKAVIEIRRIRRGGKIDQRRLERLIGLLAVVLFEAHLGANPEQ